MTTLGLTSNLSKIDEHSFTEDVDPDEEEDNEVRNKEIENDLEKVFDDISFDNGDAQYSTNEYSTYSNSGRRDFNNQNSSFQNAGRHEPDEQQSSLNGNLENQSTNFTSNVYNYEQDCDNGDNTGNSVSQLRPVWSTGNTSNSASPEICKYEDTNINLEIQSDDFEKVNESIPTQSISSLSPTSVPKQPEMLAAFNNLMPSSNNILTDYSYHGVQYSQDQLKLLYEERGREIDKKSVLVKQLKTEYAENQSKSNHDIILLKGANNSLKASNNNYQILFQEADSFRRSMEVELNEKTLELSKLTDKNATLKDQMDHYENTITKLEEQALELTNENSLAKSRELQENFVSKLRNVHNSNIKKFEYELMVEKENGEIAKIEKLRLEQMLKEYKEKYQSDLKEKNLIIQGVNAQLKLYQDQCKPLMSSYRTECENPQVVNTLTEQFERLKHNLNLELEKRTSIQNETDRLKKDLDEANGKIQDMTRSIELTKRKFEVELHDKSFALNQLQIKLNQYDEKYKLTESNLKDKLKILQKENDSFRKNDIANMEKIESTKLSVDKANQEIYRLNIIIKDNLKNYEKGQLEYSRKIQTLEQQLHTVGIIQENEFLKIKHQETGILKKEIESVRQENELFRIEIESLKGQRQENESLQLEIKFLKEQQQEQKNKIALLSLSYQHENDSATKLESLKQCQQETESLRRELEEIRRKNIKQDESLKNENINLKRQLWKKKSFEWKMEAYNSIQNHNVASNDSVRDLAIVPRTMTSDIPEIQKSRGRSQDNRKQRELSQENRDRRQLSQENREPRKFSQESREPRELSQESPDAINWRDKLIEDLKEDKTKLNSEHSTLQEKFSEFNIKQLKKNFDSEIDRKINGLLAENKQLKELLEKKEDDINTKMKFYKMIKHSYKKTRIIIENFNVHIPNTRIHILECLIKLIEQLKEQKALNGRKFYIQSLEDLSKYCSDNLLIILPEDRTPKIIDIP